MAGFEVIVRPVVFPNIRPAPARSLAPEDNPEQGVAVFSGSSGKLIDLTISESSSWSRSVKIETAREVQRERIKQKKPDPANPGKEMIDPDNYVDVARMRKLWERDAHEDTYTKFADPEPKDNVEPLGDPEIIVNPDQPTPTGDDRGGGAPGNGGGG